MRLRSVLCSANFLEIHGFQGFAKNAGAVPTGLSKFPFSTALRRFQIVRVKPYWILYTTAHKRYVCPAGRAACLRSSARLTHVWRAALDHRLFYVVGDFLANLAIGLIAGLISSAIVSPAWNMWVAMFAMMALGMVLGLVFFFPAAIKLGAMEAMVPLMFSGMLSGMVVGMAAAMMPLPVGNALALGAASGVAGIGFIWAANSMLRGVTREEN